MAADEKKDKKPEPPAILVAIPFALSPGTTNTIKLRGLNLTNVTELRFADSNLHLATKIKSKGKLEVPKDGDAKKLGDTQLEFECILPPDFQPGTNSFTVHSADGESQPRKLVVFESAKLMPEKEPNGSFREAQRLAFGKTVTGAIGENKDVDVFRLEGKAGQTLVAEVNATQYGSSLDSILTLYDEQGHVIATNDDSTSSPDSFLQAKFPSDGSYFLSLIDANDKGGPTHIYLLHLLVK